METGSARGKCGPVPEGHLHSELKRPQAYPQATGPSNTQRLLNTNLLGL